MPGPVKDWALRIDRSGKATASRVGELRPGNPSRRIIVIFAFDLLVVSVLIALAWRIRAEYPERRGRFPGGGRLLNTPLRSCTTACPAEALVTPFDADGCLVGVQTQV
jgi:hypothetical protein